MEGVNPRFRMRILRTQISRMESLNRGGDGHLPVENLLRGSSGDVAVPAPVHGERNR